MIVEEIKNEIRSLADSEKAVLLTRYFKTEHTKNDVFLGIKVPLLRSISRKYFKSITPEQNLDLLKSKYHEERLTALFIWVLQFKLGDEVIRKKIYEYYLDNTNFINNWDLVDTSARDIVGGYIFDKDQTILDKLSESNNVWERRIAMIATFYFIDRGEYAWTLKLAEKFLVDKHDYIHKASGWALREVGKKDRQILISFLDKYAHLMPRTALRYSIEHFKEQERSVYLKAGKGAK